VIQTAHLGQGRGAALVWAGQSCPTPLTWTLGCEAQWSGSGVCLCPKTTSKAAGEGARPTQAYPHKLLTHKVSWSEGFRIWRSQSRERPGRTGEFPECARSRLECDRRDGGTPGACHGQQIRSSAWSLPRTNLQS